MEPVQRSEDFVLSDVAPLVLPVLRVLDEIADRQSEVARDRGEHSDHPAPPADLHVQPLLPVGRGDPLLVDLREVIERERVLEPLFQTARGLGESLPVIVDESGGRPFGALFIRLEPDLLQMGREPRFFPMGHLGQDVPHEVDLAALPRGAQPFLPDRGLEAGVGVGDAERRPLHAPGLELAEKEAPGVLRLVKHGLHSQDLPRTGLVDAAGDHHGHRDHSPLNADLLVQGVDPEERILLVQGPALKIGELRVELLVELRDLGGGDVLDAHRMGQSLDLPRRDPR